MGKGNRNRRLSLQKEAEDRYNHPEKYQKGNKGKGIAGKNGGTFPKWAGVLACVLIAAILLGSLSLIIINGTGIVLRSKIALKTAHYEVTGTMMKYYYYFQYQSTYSNYYNMAVSYLGSADYISYFGWDLDESYAHDDELNNPCKLGTVKKDDKGNTLKDANGNTLYDSEAMTMRGGRVYTWWDYLMDQALKSAREMIVLCEAAYANGFQTLASLNPDAEAEIDEAIASVKKAASDSGLSTRAYILRMYGEGISLNDIREALVLSTIASEYSAKVEKDIRDAITDEEILEKFEKDKKKYLFADVLSATFTVDFDHILEGYINSIDTDSTTYEEDKKKAIEKAEKEFLGRLEYIKTVAEKFPAAQNDEKLFREIVMEAYAYMAFYDVYNEESDGKADVALVVEEAIKLVTEAVEKDEKVTAENKDPIAKRTAEYLYEEYTHILSENFAYSAEDDLSKWVFEAIEQNVGNVLVITDIDGEETHHMYPTVTYPEKDEEPEDETNKDETNKDETNKDETNKDETNKDETNKEESKEEAPKKESEYSGKKYNIYAGYIVKTPARNEEKSKDIGYIVLEEHAHKEGEEVDHDHVEAEFQAQDYLTKFMAGNTYTKEAFEKFAKDQGLTSGYATVEDYLRGDFGYDEIDEWLFDSTTSRVGTAGVVPVYGENDSPLYYVMVACFGEGEATWYVSVQDDILEEKYNTWHDKAVEDYSAGLTVNYSTLKVIG